MIKILRYAMAMCVLVSYFAFDGLDWRHFLLVLAFAFLFYEAMYE
jgi:hypothetical protein